jgi:hypothetical protein
MAVAAPSMSSVHADEAPTSTSLDQHSLARSILLHLLPGVAILAVCEPA